MRRRLALPFVFMIILPALAFHYDNWLTAQDFNLYNHAAVKLAWDPSPTAGVTGYIIRWGTSPGTYNDTPIDVGNVYTHTVTGLQTGYYFFVVQAYDALGNVSGYSNEVASFAIEDTFYILGPSIAELTGTTMRIGWKASHDCTCRLELTGPTFKSIVDTTNPVSDHYIRLTELTPNYKYSYELYCTDTEAAVVMVRGTFQTK